MGKQDTPQFAVHVLYFLGFVDIIRRIMHTFLIDYGIAIFAHLDLSCSPHDCGASCPITLSFLSFIYIIVTLHIPSISSYCILSTLECLRSLIFSIWKSGRPIFFVCVSRNPRFSNPPVPKKTKSTNKKFWIQGIEDLSDHCSFQVI